jgi:hypothetical protein
MSNGLFHVALFLVFSEIFILFIFQTAVLLLRIDDIVSGMKKKKEESGMTAPPPEGEH